MPRLKRYAWSFLAGAICALIVFVYFQSDRSWEDAYDKGWIVYLAVSFLIFTPQVLYDWKKYWRQGSKLDEMEMTISKKAIHAALFADYLYFVTVLMVI